MAGVALDALEDWSRSLPPHVLQPYYADLLPSLDAYLKSTGSSGTDAAFQLRAYVHIGLFRGLCCNNCSTFKLNNLVFFMKRIFHIM